MRIEAVVLHHSVGTYGLNRDGTFCNPVPQLRAHHLHRGWNDVGYHFIVGLDGNLYLGRPETRMGAHVKGHNKDTWGVCAIGNYSQEPLEGDMRAATISHLSAVIGKARSRGDDPVLYGHRELNPTECPGLKVNMDAVRREVSKKLGDLHFDRITARLAKPERDPWADYRDAPREVVKEIQGFINRVGGGPIAEDGYWGPKTEAAADAVDRLVP